MSFLPRIKKTLPAYMNTPLNEIKEYIKNSQKVESPRKSQKVESPRKSQKVENPKKTLSKLQTIVEEKINDASILPPIKKRSDNYNNNRYPVALPQITKLGGKKRTRKNKSNRRRTLRKK